MRFPEDLRGREFRWHILDEKASEIAITEEWGEIVRLVRASDGSPTYLGDLCGTRWRVAHSVAVIGPTFEIDDLDAGLTLGRSEYTHAAELRLSLHDRCYSLRQSPSASAWQDGTGDVTIFRNDGRAYVLMGCDPRDAPALLLLGTVMAAENTLFTSIGNSA